MPLSDSKENRNSDEETLVSRKNYLFPQSRRHIQFLSKDTKPVKRKVKINGKSEIFDFEDAPPSRQLVLSQVENRRKHRCLRRRSQFHTLKHEETSNFSHSV